MPSGEPSERAAAVLEHRRAGATQMMEWLAAQVRGWNAHPTPFVWGGKRAPRRQRAYERRHALGLATVDGQSAVDRGGAHAQQRHTIFRT